MRLIDADALKKAILAEPWKNQNNAVRLTVDYINIIIDEQPTVDAVPVVRGRWIHKEIEDDDWGGSWHKWSCSNCTYAVGHNPSGLNYCAKCGAKMDGGAVDD